METDFFSHTGPAFGQRQQPYSRHRNRGEYGGSGDYEGHGYRQRPHREVRFGGIPGSAFTRAGTYLVTLLQLAQIMKVLGTTY